MSDRPTSDDRTPPSGDPEEPSKRATSMPVARPIAVAEPSLPDDNESNEDAIVWQDWWQQVPSWLTSTVFHLLLVLLLAMITTMPEIGGGGGGDDTSLRAAGDGLEEGAAGLAEQMMQMSAELADLERPPATVENQLSEVPIEPVPLATLGPALADVPLDLAPAIGGLGSGKMENVIGSGPGTGRVGDGPGSGDGTSLGLRMDEGTRSELIKREGGTPESEKAVADALHWLAEHQNYDGSWTFQHQKSPKCHGTCDNPGSTPGKNAATALALLPFLGTGQTHLDGQYRRQVDMGLKYLVRSMEVQGDLGSLWERPGGEMYGHGLGAIALCEAYGMTRDRSLEKAAQQSINFIIEAQHSAGGWRYSPGDPGDTSVVGWQLMALRSAQLAYLRVSPLTLRRTGYFLDSVQSDAGASYGYNTPSSRRPATTAIGLLCRMYLGWKHDHRALQRGVQTLGTLGPSIDTSSFSRNNMYYNYYATQVMHHYGGYPWKKWNDVMREYLIATQSKQGHEAGSWFLEGSDHGEGTGGRLYFTAMAAMTLEVYYRYMPLYRDDSTNFNR